MSGGYMGKLLPILSIGASYQTRISMTQLNDYQGLFVNVVGSLMMGFLSILFLDRLDISPEWRAAILVGLLGSFTTFSTFSIETLNLLEQGDLVRAILNVGLSVVICIMAVWLGVVLGRQI